MTSHKMHLILKHWHEVEFKEFTKENYLQNSGPYSIQVGVREK